MILKTISPSKLQMYADCPRCFYLCIEKYPQVTTGDMTFGTRLHKAIELYHKEGLQFVDPDLQDYLDEYTEVYDRDFEIAEEFWQVPLFDTDVKLNLKIDLVKDGFVTDHKTSKRTFTQGYVDQMRQLTAYAYAYRVKFEQEEKGLRINLFNTNPDPGVALMTVIDTVREQLHFDQWEEWVYEILQGIEDDYFEPKKAMWHNYALCPMFVPRD